MTTLTNQEARWRTACAGWRYIEQLPTPTTRTRNSARAIAIDGWIAACDWYIAHHHADYNAESSASVQWDNRLINQEARWRTACAGWRYIEQLPEATTRTRNSARAIAIDGWIAACDWYIAHHHADYNAESSASVQWDNRRRRP